MPKSLETFTVSVVVVCCIIASAEVWEADFGDDGDIDDESFDSINVDDDLIADLLVWNDEVYDDFADCNKLVVSLDAAIAAAAARAGEARWLVEMLDEVEDNDDGGFSGLVEHELLLDVEQSLELSLELGNLSFSIDFSNDFLSELEWEFHWFDDVFFQEGSWLSLMGFIKWPILSLLFDNLS